MKIIFFFSVSKIRVCISFYREFLISRKRKKNLLAVCVDEKKKYWMLASKVKKKKSPKCVKKNSRIIKRVYVW